MADNPDIAYALQLPPEEAIRYFGSKGLRLTKSWNELLDGQHTGIHTVAHLGKLDLLQRVYQELLNAFRDGLTVTEFETRLTGAMQAAGWWGKAIDATTGEVLEAYPGSSRPVQYGSPARLELIYRQNLQTAYMAGRYQGAADSRQTHPYWQYVAIRDSRTRPSHAALNGRVFRRDDPAMDSIYPPNGWNCRCRTRPMTEARIRAEKLTVEDSRGKLVMATVPAGRYPDGTPKRTEVTGVRTGHYDADGKEIILFPDAGWSYNPGQSWQLAQRATLQATLGHIEGLVPDASDHLKAAIRNILDDKTS